MGLTYLLLYRSVPKGRPFTKRRKSNSNPSTDTSALESDIDVLVYGLYGLSEEEIAVISGE
ncbi:hypothetical protein [Bernardetia litoralis]|uniref:hypothetical protein n=1 Tax=Bernardetia litoralis TaxID=999 RepID=UPI0012FE1475|nr:hypothetical protein [Bernardetia litoralis]